MVMDSADRFKNQKAPKIQQIQVNDFLATDKRQTLENFMSREETKLQMFRALFPMSYNSMLAQQNQQAETA